MLARWDDERCVLGAVMLGADPGELSMVVQPEHMSRADHAEIWSAVLRLHGSAQWSHQQGILQLLDQVDRQHHGLLASLGDHALGLEAAQAAASRVRQAWARRRAVAVLQQAAQLAADGADLDEVWARAESGRADADSGQVRDARLSAVYERVYEELLERMERRATGDVVSVPLPLGLDSALTLEPGELVVLAARPGVGKSTMADQICSHALDRGLHVGMVSLEMSELQIVAREAGAELGFAARRASRGELERAHLSAMRDWIDRVSQRRGWLYEDAALTVEQIAMRAQTHASSSPLDLLIVDHIGLITPTDRRQSRTDQVGHCSRQLKILAKRLRTCVIALSQLNRESERRADRRPILSDLRSSGDIEQDADTVIFIHREGMYDESRADHAEVIVAKQRQGQIGALPLRWDEDRARFAPQGRSAWSALHAQ